MEGSASANGQALAAYLESAHTVLAGVGVVDYYQMPLPSELDHKLREITRAFSALPTPQRDKFMAGLEESERALFAIFGHRAATLAIRANDPDWLRIGLIGNVIANHQIPQKREITRSLAIYHYCSTELNLDPETLFNEAATIAGEEMALQLHLFSAQKDVSLKRYGWRRIQTPEGISFKFDWS